MTYYRGKHLLDDAKTLDLIKCLNDFRKEDIEIEYFTQYSDLIVLLQTDDLAVFRKIANTINKYLYEKLHIVDETIWNRAPSEIEEEIMNIRDALGLVIANINETFENINEHQILIDTITDYMEKLSIDIPAEMEIETRKLLDDLEKVKAILVKYNYADAIRELKLIENIDALLQNVALNNETEFGFIDDEASEKQLKERRKTIKKYRIDIKKNVKLNYVLSNLKEKSLHLTSKIIKKNKD